MKPDELPADSALETASAPETAGASETASPFPPAFRWEASPPEEQTQIIGAVGVVTAPGGDPAAGTRAARSGPAYQQRPTHVPDLFQPAHQPIDESFDRPGDRPGGRLHDSPVGRPKDRPVDRAMDSSAPPWADSDLPLMAEQQNAWMRQGPDVFTASAPSLSRTKQTLGIAVLAVVVLGLAGATVGYVLTSGSPDQAGGGQVSAPQPIAPPRDLPAPPAPLPAPVDTDSALIEPPGQLRGGGGPFDLPKLESIDLLPQPVLNTLGARGMTDGVLKTTTFGGTTIGMFALTVPDQQAATDVVAAITAVQRDGGLKVDNNRSLKGVAVLGSDPASTPTVYRAVYVLYNRAIFFEVFGPDRDAVQAGFDSLINQQVKHAPPTVWTGR